MLTLTVKLLDKFMNAPILESEPLIIKEPDDDWRPYSIDMLDDEELEREDD